MIKNSLAIVNPKLAKEWHPTKNGKLTPNDVVPGSAKKVWWKCLQDDDHEWQAILRSRNRGTGCPICSNRKVIKSNSLAILNPELAKEWHSTRNKDLSPNDVTPFSSKKVWWKGKCGHEWPAVIRKRVVRGQGCPECRGKRISASLRKKNSDPGQLSLF